MTRTSENRMMASMTALEQAQINAVDAIIDRVTAIVMAGHPDVAHDDRLGDVEARLTAIELLLVDIKAQLGGGQ